MWCVVWGPDVVQLAVKPLDRPIQIVEEYDLAQNPTAESSRDID